MALTDSRDTSFAGAVPERVTLPIAANTRIFKGSLVGENSSGQAIPATTSATCVRVIGKASATYDNRTGSVLGGSAAACDVEIECGVFNWVSGTAGDTINADDIGKLCYASDDQTVNLTSNAGTRPIAGLIVDYRPAKAGGSSVPWVFTSPIVPVFYDTLTTLASTNNAEGASLIGVEDSAGYFDTHNVEACLAQIIADLAATTATHGANMIGFQDSGNKTAATTVDTVLDALLVEGTSTLGEVVLGPQDFVLSANGAPLAVWAADNVGTVGLYCDGTKALGLRWNNAGGGATIGVASTFKVPTDMDLTVAPTVYIKAAKVGATLADATTFPVGVYAQTEAALYDAGANLGATSGAMTGDAVSKTVQLVNTGAITALPAAASACTVTLAPTPAVLTTDDVIVFVVIVKYTRKLRAS